MIKTIDILGMGAALVDILVRCSDDLLLQHGFEKGRMHLIEADRAAALQAEATQMQAGGAKLISGGSAANTCLGVASFSDGALQAAFMGGVAADGLGQIFADDLAASGVSFHNIVAPDNSAATGYCICFVTPDGERTMATYLGASGSFAADSDVEAQAAAARLLYIEGYIWDTPTRVTLADRAIRTAKQSGGQVALTISDSWCANAYRDHFLRYCREGLVDILFANEAELCALTQADTFDAALVAVKDLVPLGVFTRGADGAVIQQTNQIVTIAATPVATVTDTTGAGDSFAAGFLYGQLAGLSLEKSGHLGARAAAQIIGQLGARPRISFSILKESV